jgi:hypothetical protein
MNQQPAPIPAPLKAAVGNITTGTNALAASNTGNKNLAAGVNVSGNLARVNANNNKAAKAFNMGANNINKALVNTNNLNKKLKNSLVIAQKHFTTAAINAAANQPIKAANHARRGIGALKNYIGANLANA